ncbi:hypothetical protein WICMUC_003730 [Wickerhamomyces mucosus]|uniref:Helicase SWR1 n=1 Tax=Wickerhamomyces mucosus TaxID=1378264 RepID=A0A9P8PJP4_9ASCO|nr:hypothetical protein WICMUC_003730 [Wickerhamomyces mucosus]
MSPNLTPTRLRRQLSNSSESLTVQNSQDNNIMPSAKRRKSSRHHTQINYSESRIIRDSIDQNIGKSIENKKSSNKDHNHSIISLKNGTKSLDQLEKYQNRELSNIDQLSLLQSKHQLLVEELYHLDKFTSLATWNPELIQMKSPYDNYEQYDLWKLDIPNGRSKRSSSRVQPIDPLKSIVDQSQLKFNQEVKSPSKYYNEFVVRKDNKIVNNIVGSIQKNGKTIDQKFDKSIKIENNNKPNKSNNIESSIKNKDKHLKSKLKQESIVEKIQPIKINKKFNSKSKGKIKTSNGKSNEEEKETISSDLEDFLDSDAEDLKELLKDPRYNIDNPEPLFSNDEPIPKLRLYVQSLPPKATNPDQIPEIEFNGSLTKFLNSFKSLEEDITNEEYESYIDEQQELVSKLRIAVDKKIITVDSKDSTIRKAPPPIPFKDPLITQPSHHDHMVGQAIHLSKLLGDLKKQRIQRARKVSQMIESHFKKLAGAEERKLKEEEKRLKTLARNAIQSVKKRWVLAEKAYKILKNREAEELRRIKGKEHLSQMLEHSTQLLEAQMTKQTDNEEEEEEEDVDRDQSNDSDNDQQINEDDSNLTIEQLKIKYAHLQNLKFEEVSESNLDSDKMDVDEISETQDIDSPEIEIQLNDDEKLAVENANKEKHSSLLDSESDSSLDSDDESDYTSEEEDNEEEETGKSTGGGLASLFGTAVPDEDDNDVEFADSEHEDSNDEDEVEEEDDGIETDAATEKAQDTPNSTPEPEKLNTDDSKISRIASQDLNDGVVDVPNPSAILRGDLRYYQKQGLNWLASLYNNNTNGILADEMGLGKTIQTISLISYLAVSKGIWGPHLIVVPTSVLLNWEMEFKRFAPGLKVLVYYGSPQQRKEKRKGWNKPDTFHVCITSYQLVCQDQQIFKRKRWRYMILDEAHNIKNFKSNRWNALLNFNTENRLLLTGTPLQNNIMELWSLLYFLMPSSKVTNQSMPSGFANLDDFQQWFGKPVDKIIENGVNSEVDEETKKTVSKLHQVLRPYLLRRLKADVESQMPGKFEHVVYCRLSKRQYKLYHEYLARSDTKEMLKNANYISIINCLMQLRKVCNHPDLFEERPITTSFVIPKSIASDYESTNNLAKKLLGSNLNNEINFDVLNLNFSDLEKTDLTTFQSNKIRSLRSSRTLLNDIEKLSKEVKENQSKSNFSDIQKFYKHSINHQKQELLRKLEHVVYLNNLRCEKTPLYGCNLIKRLTVVNPLNIDVTFHEELIKPLDTRMLSLNDEIEKFAFVTPEVVTLDMPKLSLSKELAIELSSNENKVTNPLHKVQTKLSIQFPEKSLLLYDCGKLQKLSKLLQDLKDGGHRALIFTQMTKVLDILEQFLNIMGIRYMRLDGATKIEDRQILTERFNSDPKITVFILSTRSGGLGINLTGADTVIFYDSDWNPAMDKQCQDRCHRIGQTRDVHIYRFVSEYTIESNILRKANQKRHLDNVVIQEGEFTTDYFGKLSVTDLIGADEAEKVGIQNDSKPLIGDSSKIGNVLAQAEDDADAVAAKEAMKEVELDNDDFVEDESKKVGEEDNDLFDRDEDGIGHIDEYMIRYIANGYYYD